jgi:hypothetical protein
MFLHRACSLYNIITHGALIIINTRPKLCSVVIIIISVCSSSIL